MALDAFKSAYVNMTAMHGMDLSAADFSSGVQNNLWQLLTLEEAPPGRWFRLLGTSRGSTIMIKDAVVGIDRWGGKNLISASGKHPLWTENNMKALHAWLEEKSRDAAFKSYLGLPEKTEEMTGAVLSTGYSFIKQQQAGLYMLARYHNDPDVRMKALKWIDKIDETWPGNTRMSTTGSTIWLYSKNFQQLDLISEQKIRD
mgnify:CR=1 FL=1